MTSKTDWWFISAGPPTRSCLDQGPLDIYQLIAGGKFIEISFFFRYTSVIHFALTPCSEYVSNKWLFSNWKQNVMSSNLYLRYIIFYRGYSQFIMVAWQLTSLLFGWIHVSSHLHDKYARWMGVSAELVISGSLYADGCMRVCCVCVCVRGCAFSVGDSIPDSKVHGANMGPIWGRQDPGGPHVGPMNLAICDEWVISAWSLVRSGTHYRMCLCALWIGQVVMPTCEGMLYSWFHYRWFYSIFYSNVVFIVAVVIFILKMLSDSAGKSPLKKYIFK